MVLLLFKIQLLEVVLGLQLQQVLIILVSSSALSTGNINTTIGYNSSANNYSYSTAIGYNSTVTANNQVMLGTSAETVVIPASCTISIFYKHIYF